MGRRVALHSVVRKQDIGALMHFLCTKATRKQHHQIAQIVTQMVPDYRPTPLPAVGHTRGSAAGPALKAKLSRVAPLPSLQVLEALNSNHDPK